MYSLNGLSQLHLIADEDNIKGTHPHRHDIRQRYLAGFVDHIGFAGGLAFPLLAASSATLLITALAALRHVRQALTLQPIEALR